MYIYNIYREREGERERESFSIQTEFEYFDYSELALIKRESRGNIESQSQV